MLALCAFILQFQAITIYCRTNLQPNSNFTKNLINDEFFAQ